MKKLLFLIVLLMASKASFSMPTSCWVVDRMDGVGFFKPENYKQKNDSISSQTTILFNGDNSLVSYHDLPLMQVSDYMLVGLAVFDGKVEGTAVYFIDINNKKAIFTRVRTEPKLFAGVVTMVGDARPCQ